jgi:hypothetical protein
MMRTLAEASEDAFVQKYVDKITPAELHLSHHITREPVQIANVTQFEETT